MAITASAIDELTTEEIALLRKVEDFIDEELRTQNRKGFIVYRIPFKLIRLRCGELNSRFILEITTRYQKVGWKVEVYEKGSAEREAFHFEVDPTKVVVYTRLS